MLGVARTNKFKRDAKRMKRRGADLKKLQVAIDALVRGLPLPKKYLDHALKGEWGGRRELHLAPDFLLVYKIVDNELRLERVGSHADIFK